MGMSDRRASGAVTCVGVRRAQAHAARTLARMNLPAPWGTQAGARHIGRGSRVCAHACMRARTRAHAHSRRLALVTSAKAVAFALTPGMETIASVSMWSKKRGLGACGRCALLGPQG